VDLCDGRGDLDDRCLLFSILLDPGFDCLAYGTHSQSSRDNLHMRGQGGIQVKDAQWEGHNAHICSHTELYLVPQLGWFEFLTISNDTECMH